MDSFLDSDDEWLHDSLALRLQLAEKGRLPVVHSECYVANQGSTELRRFGLPLLRKPGTVFPSLLVLKECFQRIGYLDETFLSYQEWDTSIRLAKYYWFGFVPEPNFFYDCRYTEAISKDSLRRRRDTNRCLQSTFGPSSAFWGPRL
jgi:GT2 family glycosyltransferase